ncbi:multicopper oxidase domain-containing protein [Xanthobacter sp. V4C-4]|uniref:multicopper oxidase family protein n=1 Tax=Xanthobacter cornucopiae TaxID=3119924 RepID=UPI003727B0EC
MSRPRSTFRAPSRRAVLAGGLAAGALVLAGRQTRAQPAARLTVDSATLEVNGRAATVFTVKGPDGADGVFAKAGERLVGGLRNASETPLVMHWHGQLLVPAHQDRARPDGGALEPGGLDLVDFVLTPGTHWMHAHTLSEQQLLAAPLIAREIDAGDAQDVVMMLHDFSFRSPEEILAALDGSSGGRRGHARLGRRHRTEDGETDGGGGVQVHDVTYDAFLANRRTLDDPEVVPVEPGGRARLRIINGATATAFFITVPGLTASAVAVDGSPCVPAVAETFPLAQGQRLDLLVDIPAEGGAFPVLAQVEASPRRTGLILATPGASVSRLAPEAERNAGVVDLAFEASLAAVRPLEERAPARVFPIVLGEEPDYRWTINDRVPENMEGFVARQGERVEMTFMNPTGMTHPMHLHGHHFQVVGIDGRRFAGAVRDTVIVPPRVSVTVAFDAGQKGEWFLHCHHLYHMAAGMMAVVKVV